MVQVTQTEIVTAAYVPYERPPDSAALWTAIPRGLSTFSFSGVLDAKPVNDTFLLKIVGICPPNFGYVMNDLGWNIMQDVAGKWTTKCSLKLRTFYRGSDSALTGWWPISNTMCNKSNDVRALDSSTNTKEWPTFPLVTPLGSPGVQWDFEAWNADVDVGATGVLNFWISFWQFDLEQIRKYPINSPLPVHAR